MPTLDLSNVSKRYGRKTVLAEVNLQLSKGLSLLVGPSGAGKSTLLRLIATAERPTSGTLVWNGAALPAARKSLRRSLGYAPQAVDLPEDLTALEFALHMAALKELDRGASEAQARFLADALGLGDDLERRISTYSGGMRRRLILLQAILGDPQLLALDEPTAELDSASIARVVALIRERASTAIVVMTTHLEHALAGTAQTSFHVEQGEVRPL
ncbi:ABC-type multidrug transport system ATPase subunit [Sphingomonas trueperi]